MYTIKQFNMQMNILNDWKFQRLLPPPLFYFQKDGCHQDGYIYNSRLSLCWKPFSQKVNYIEALQTCLRDRGRLLRVFSFPIWEYLKTELGESLKERHVKLIYGNEEKKLVISIYRKTRFSISKIILQCFFNMYYYIYVCWRSPKNCI